jgi:UDP-N-acetylmuramate--alanine ligase
MELDKIKNVYLLGIGGIGMSALARYFKASGKLVAGYDKTATTLTDTLIAEGIAIHFDDNIQNIDKAFHSASDTLIIYSPAVPKENLELNYFINNNFTIHKRAKVLGSISNATKTIAVAGTHGKTTTSSLIAHILHFANLNPSAFLGGITQNYQTNLLISKTINENTLTVVEADEYDRSFLHLHPEIAIITSIDADHLDIYGDKKQIEESYSLFAQQAKSTLILNRAFSDSIVSDKQVITYALTDNTAMYYATNIRIENAAYHYDVVTPSKTIKNISLGLPGHHNVENSIAAIVVADLLIINYDTIHAALSSFKGVKRRFDYQVKTEKIVYIDDYAHHPTELTACINSAKEMYPTKKITGIFQPHLFSRTRDFADEFAASLDLLDECILLDIYPARELPIEGITSAMLLEKMRLKHKSVCKKENILNTISTLEIDVLLTLGAGDIDTLVTPIKDYLIPKAYL